MKELGIALEMAYEGAGDSEKNLPKKYVLIPWLINDLTVEDISKAAEGTKEPNLYSIIDKWEGVKWANDDDLRELRRNVAQDDIPTWRSRLKSLTGIGIRRSDQVKGEED